MAGLDVVLRLDEAFRAAKDYEGFASMLTEDVDWVTPVVPAFPASMFPKHLSQIGKKEPRQKSRMEQSRRADSSTCGVFPYSEEGSRSARVTSSVLVVAKFRCENFGACAAAG